MSEKFRFPAAEYYELPRNPHEQADEELRTYKTPEQMRANLVALKLGYEKTYCMQSMKRYAEYAAVVRSPESTVGTDSFNADFYSGSLMAVHINLAPASEGVQRKVLGNDFLPDFTDSPKASTIEASLKEWFTGWAGDGKDNWEHFYNLQSEDYQQRAMALSDRLYCDRADSFERQFDFILGYTFASNMVWTCGMAYRSKAPV